MYCSPAQQKGLTFISLLFVLAIVGSFALLGIKIVPIYMDHSKVVSALQAMKESPDLATQSVDQIKNSLAKRFSMNYVNAITYNDIKITKHNNYVKLQAQYEVVEKIIGNASVLVQFDDTVETGVDS